jgi:tetratricopeptide (TPR) repeat protein
MNSLWNRNTLLVGLFILSTLTAYIPAVQGGFVWDDDSYITENQTLRSLQGLRQIWLNPRSTPQYYPLVFSSFWLEYRLWGLRPTGYHLVNVLLHTLSALLLWRLLRELRVPGALLAAAIFALHPVNVESVAWVTERKNVLSAFFYFVSMFCLFRFFGLAGEKKDQGNLWWYLAGLLLFVFALLSKTITCTLPAALLLVLWWKKGRVGRRELAALGPFLLCGLALGLATAWLEKHHVGAVGPEWDLTFVERCLIAGRALWFYLGKLVWPKELIFNYPRWQVDASVWWQYMYPAGVIWVVLLLWIIRHRVGRGPLVGVLFFCGTLFPALGFFDVYPFQYSYVADHFQYLASVGFIVLLIGVLRKVISMLPHWSPRIATPLGLMVLVFLGWQTWNQGHIYRDIETLWIDTIRKNPMSWMAHNNLGVELTRQGRFEEAISHYRETLRLYPSFAKAHNNLGFALAQQGKVEEAISYYLEALRLNRNLHKTRVNLDEVLDKHDELAKLIKPEAESLVIPSEYASALSNLGVAMAHLGKFDQATDYCQRALELRPQWSEGQNNLGNALAAQGKFNEAVLHLSQAVELKPDYAEGHNNLAVVYGRLGRFAEASAHYRKAIQLKPHSAEIHNNLGVALAAQGKLDEAVEHYNRAVELKPKYAEAHMNLGNGLCDQGDFHGGTAHLRRALTIDRYSPEIHNNLGVALARQGKLEEAIAHFTVALKLQPTYEQAQLNLQIALEQRESGKTN